MRVRIRALEQANQNAQNDSSLMKTAKGAVDNTIDILRTLKAKAIDAANDSNTDEDRQIIQKEVNQLVDQIDDNALVTFNGKYMLNSSSGTTITHTSNSPTWSRTILLNQSLATDNTMGTAPTALKIASVIRSAFKKATCGKFRGLSTEKLPSSREQWPRFQTWLSFTWAE